MSAARFVLAMAWRESRSSLRRLGLLMAAVSAGVAALVSINSFSANLQASVQQQARAVLGADLALGSGNAFSARAEALLAELRAKGFRLAVLTNCDDDLFEMTHRTFRAPFDLFVTAERVRGYKPAPWHFRAFELITGARRDEWVHVACSWYHDIAPAQALGIRRVWLDRERTGQDPRCASVRVHSAPDAACAIDALFQ
jgi:FMN phosphatase YigB (HAD superfamily)